jgi:hypothetical protein
VRTRAAFNDFIHHNLGSILDANVAVSSHLLTGAVAIRDEQIRLIYIVAIPRQ